MSHGNQSYLRFSLEESVWFQRGQEVEELISISLDPNITINESDQYVTIKGSLELYGEYNRDENEVDDENESFSNPKFIQIVDVREEGVHLFTHHFPVEITIPKNRIQDIENIDVAVETFDYAFPEKSCLRLSADLMITGLYGEQQHEIVKAEDDEFVEEEPDFEPLFRTQDVQDIQVEIEDEDDQEDQDDQDDQEILISDEFGGARSPFSKPVYEEEESNEIYEPFEVEARKQAKAEETLASLIEEADREEIQQDVFDQVQYEEQREPAAETYDFSEPEPEPEPELELEPELEPEESYTGSLPEITFAAKRNEPGAADTKTPKSTIETVSPKVEQQEEDVALEESSSEPQVKKKKRKKKQSLSITEFLARKEEESHTKLKVCIVQKGDTIDGLSDRYDVSVSQLQRVNNLEINQDVYEGQVLYIPVVQKQK